MIRILQNMYWIVQFRNPDGDTVSERYYGMEMEAKLFAHNVCQMNNYTLIGYYPT